MALLERVQFTRMVKSALPVGKELANPGGGTTKILSYSESNICYQRGNSRIYVGFADLYVAYRSYHGRKVTSSDLKTYAPAVFDSKHNGHSCNATFLFQVLVAIGIVKRIQGEGKAGHPFYVDLVE